MFYFVYCNNCALKDVNGACWCTCSLVALRLPEMCFWPAKTRKGLNFLRCIYVIDLVLKYGSDINEGNWLQLLFFHCTDGYSCRRYCNEFFSAMFQVLDWSFLALHFDVNMCNWIPKVIWPWMDWFWGFLLESGFFCWLHICIDWNLHEMLNCYSILTTSFFFDV